MNGCGASKMPSTVTEVKRRKRKKCWFCSMPAVTVCDHGWKPDDPTGTCNAPICARHTQQVPEPDGQHVKEYCPRHEQKIEAVANA